MYSVECLDKFRLSFNSSFSISSKEFFITLSVNPLLYYESPPFYLPWNDSSMFWLQVGTNRVFVKKLMILNQVWISSERVWPFRFPYSTKFLLWSIREVFQFLSDVVLPVSSFSLTFWVIKPSEISMVLLKTKDTLFFIFKYLQITLCSLICSMKSFCIRNFIIQRIFLSVPEHESLPSEERILSLISTYS